jgi:4'-phosphopantetheinyl transferase
MTGDSGERVDIYIVKLNGVRDLLSAEEARCPRLAADELRRAELGDVGGEARADWLSARLATRIILERHAGCAIRQQPFVIEPRGRPVLRSGALAFSVAHSGGVALVAVTAPGRAIGIDIEASRVVRMKPERQAQIIAAAAVLSGRDQSQGGGKDGGAIAASFLKAWVELEAYGKAQGTGIGPVLSIALRQGPEAMRALPRLAIGHVDVGLGPNHFAAIATSQPMPGLLLRQFPSTASALQRFVSKRGRDGN